MRQLNFSIRTRTHFIFNHVLILKFIIMVFADIYTTGDCPDVTLWPCELYYRLIVSDSSANLSKARVQSVNFRLFDISLNRVPGGSSGTSSEYLVNMVL